MSTLSTRSSLSVSHVQLRDAKAELDAAKRGTAAAVQDAEADAEAARAEAQRLRAQVAESEEEMNRQSKKKTEALQEEMEALRVEAKRSAADLREELEAAKAALAQQAFGSLRGWGWLGALVARGTDPLSSSQNSLGKALWMSLCMSMWACSHTMARQTRETEVALEGIEHEKAEKGRLQVIKCSIRHCIGHFIGHSIRPSIIPANIQSIVFIESSTARNKT